jgi:beta-glucosidase
VVLNAGGNVDMRGWLNSTKALVHAWYPGGEGNIALAEILLGITNPSGKLPVSFEKRWEDNATYKSYYDDDGDKHVKYSEGIFLGYRHFDKDSIEPQFPFGFGLSYTTFEYSDLVVNKNQFSPNEPVEVQLTVKNKGKTDGAEVVQLYVRDPVSSAPRPVKELKAFAKVMLKAGKNKKVKFTLHSDAFQFFHPDKSKWVVEPGKFTILVGSSSRDIKLSKEITIQE